MQVDIRPDAFVLSALSGTESTGFEVESQATRALLTQPRIPIDSMRGASLLKPYLKLILTGGSEKLTVVVRFQCLKDGRVIHSVILDRKYQNSLLMDPEELPDIRPFGPRNRLLGEWRIEVHVALFATKTLAHISESSYPNFLKGLRFKELLVYDFEIVRNDDGDIELTAIGRMVQPRRDTGTTYQIDDL